MRTAVYANFVDQPSTDKDEMLARAYTVHGFSKFTTKLRVRSRTTA
jgi:hypothetical protein